MEDVAMIVITLLTVNSSYHDGYTLGEDKLSCTGT